MKDMLLAFIVVGALAHAEGVEERLPFASSPTRLRGAATIRPLAGGGFVALGGPALRQLDAGRTAWRTLHTVPRDNLYRVADDRAGRLLAEWEKEPCFHLFVPKEKRHVTFRKPAPPSSEFRIFNLDDLCFSADGTAAIVFMEGLTGNTAWTTVVYRQPLDGTAAPTLLCRQTGLLLHARPNVAVFAVPKDEQRPCNGNGCWPIASILAYEIDGATATRRIVRSGEGDRMDIPRMIRGGDGERIALDVTERPNARWLLRWRVGTDETSYTPLPKAPSYTWHLEATWLTKSGDLIEAWRTEDLSLALKRFPPGREPRTTTFPPFPVTDPDAAADSSVYTLKERANGDLLLHWGDHLILIGAEGAARTLNIKPLLKRRNEWAGADIYVPDPEALWLGVEVGANRDFVQLSFADIDKRATPSR